MGFDWREYISLAQFLCTQSTLGFNREAGNRASVSRAYFGAFCHTRNYVRDNEKFIPENNDSDHKKLREYFQQRGGRLVRIASLLQQLRVWRNQCDYEDASPDFSLLTKSAIDKAQEIVKILPQIKS